MYVCNKILMVRISFDALSPPFTYTADTHNHNYECQYCYDYNPHCVAFIIGNFINFLAEYESADRRWRKGRRVLRATTMLKTVFPNIRGCRLFRTIIKSNTILNFSVAKCASWHFELERLNWIVGIVIIVVIVIRLGRNKQEKYDCYLDVFYH